MVKKNVKKYNKKMKLVFTKTNITEHRYRKSMNDNGLFQRAYVAHHDVINSEYVTSIEYEYLQKKLQEKSNNLHDADPNAMVFQIVATVNVDGQIFKIPGKTTIPGEPIHLPQYGIDYTIGGREDKTKWKYVKIDVIYTDSDELIPRLQRHRRINNRLQIPRENINNMLRRRVIRNDDVDNDELMNILNELREGILI